MAAERRIKALTLRKMGHTYPTIAQTLGVNVSTAYRDVQWELQQLATEAREETSRFRALELSRLDTIISKWWDTAVTRANPKAMGHLLRAIELRARVLGVDLSKGISPMDAEFGETEALRRATSANAAVANYIGISIGTGAASDPSGAGVGGTVNSAGLPGSSLQGADAETLRSILEARLKVPRGSLPLSAVSRAVELSPGVELVAVEKSRNNQGLEVSDAEAEDDPIEAEWRETGETAAPAGGSTA